MKKRVPRRLSLSVVGMQYRVTASTREMISDYLKRNKSLMCKLSREKQNPVDPNAIRVLISEEPYTGLFIGYLNRQVAETLAPALDTGRVVAGRCLLIDVHPRNGEGEIVVTLKTDVNFPANKLKTVG